MISTTESGVGMVAHAPMARCRALHRRTSARLAVTLAGAALGGAAVWGSPVVAHADAVAYLVNVTVRPGYGFPDAQAALAYGNGVCDQLRSGTGYPSIMAGVKSDLGTSDEYQASYLITQAANELCPAAIWQLRHSAAGYHLESE